MRQVNAYQKVIESAGRIDRYIDRQAKWNIWFSAARGMRISCCMALRIAQVPSISSRNQSIDCLS